MAFNSGSSCLELLIAGITGTYTIIISSELPFSKDSAEAGPRLADGPVLLLGGIRERGNLECCSGMKTNDQICQSIGLFCFVLFCYVDRCLHSGQAMPSEGNMLTDIHSEDRKVQSQMAAGGSAISLVPR